MGFIDFLISFFGAGAGAAVLGFFAKDWLALRIKTSIEKELFIQKSAFELKRSACLEALAAVDATLSNQTWTDKGVRLDVVKQPLDISAARSAYNQLALTCSNPAVITKYVEVLGLREPSEKVKSNRGDLIVDLRNEMRKELGFGEELKFDRNKAWIANLDGAT